MRDIDGRPLPERLWHGVSETFGDHLLPAAAAGRWWKVMDHDEFMTPFEDEDPDAACEWDHLTRTAYGNIAYDVLRSSDDPEIAEMASRAGLDGLGREVSILFVTEDERYARGYGDVAEIDLNCEGFICAVRDENALRAASWMLVFKAGSPTPFVTPKKNEIPAPGM